MLHTNSKHWNTTYSLHFDIIHPRCGRKRGNRETRDHSATSAVLVDGHVGTAPVRLGEKVKFMDM